MAQQTPPYSIYAYIYMQYMYIHKYVYYINCSIILYSVSSIPVTDSVQQFLLRIMSLPFSFFYINLDSIFHHLIFAIYIRSWVLLYPKILPDR